MTLDEEIDAAFELAIGQLERPMGTQSAQHVMETMRAYTKSLVREEREACAKVCEIVADGNEHVGDIRGMTGCEECAAAIRARAG